MEQKACKYQIWHGWVNALAFPPHIIQVERNTLLPRPATSSERKKQFSLYLTIGNPSARSFPFGKLKHLGCVDCLRDRQISRVAISTRIYTFLVLYFLRSAMDIAACGVQFSPETWQGFFIDGVFPLTAAVAVDEISRLEEQENEDFTRHKRQCRYNAGFRILRQSK